MFRVASLALLPLAAGLAACGSNTNPASCTAPGGAVAGALDTHCGATVQPTSQAACLPPDAGVGDDGGVPQADYGDTMYNAEGDDDDCKYHVKWSATTICENAGVYFTVVATNKTDNSPLVGAEPFPEVFLDDVTPGDVADTDAVENPPGTYKMGPVTFHKPGNWTVRFHFYHECSDADGESPHGHAAFFVQVP